MIKLTLTECNYFDIIQNEVLFVQDCSLSVNYVSDKELYLTSLLILNNVQVTPEQFTFIIDILYKFSDQLNNKLR